MTRSSKVAAAAIVTVLALLLYPRPAPQSGPNRMVLGFPGMALSPLDDGASQGSAQSGAPSVPVLGRVDSPSANAATPTPHETGGIGQPASYCRQFCDSPEPRVVVSKGSGGWATWWFSFGHGLYAALRPDLGTKGDLAIVCGGEPYHCLSLPVITTCACLGPGSDRLIDLSRDAFESFAPASAGVVHITLQVIEGGAP